jgi:hypothetical protein
MPFLYSVQIEGMPKFTAKYEDEELHKFHSSKTNSTFNSIIHDIAKITLMEKKMVFQILQQMIDYQQQPHPGSIDSDDSDDDFLDSDYDDDVFVDSDDSDDDFLDSDDSYDVFVDSDDDDDDFVDSDNDDDDFVDSDDDDDDFVDSDNDDDDFVDSDDDSDSYEIIDSRSYEETYDPKTIKFSLPYSYDMNSYICFNDKRTICQAIRYNNGIHTQCCNYSRDGSIYCTRCRREASFNENRIPNAGNIELRNSVPSTEYIDPYGRKTLTYATYLYKRGFKVQDIKSICNNIFYNVDHTNCILHIKNKTYDLYEPK